MSSTAKATAPVLLTVPSDVQLENVEDGPGEATRWV
jgi:hypothetical protein